MFLDVALEQLQSELTLGFVSTVFQKSPNTCGQQSNCCSPSYISENSQSDRFSALDGSTSTMVPPSPVPCHESTLGRDALPTPTTLILPPRLRMDSSNYESVGESEPPANQKQSIDIPSNNIMINPVYLLKEMFGCLVVSLLAMQIRFNEIDEIYSDVCDLLIQPTPTSKWGYGFPVFESMAKLREKTLLNASVEHTQFARGFYQTQAQRKTFTKSRHMPSPSRPSNSPFIIPSAINLLPSACLLSPPDMCAPDPPTDCTSDPDYSFVLRSKFPRLRLPSETSSLVSSREPSSFQRQNSGTATQRSAFDSPPSMRPTSTAKLASRLVDLSVLRKEAQDNPSFHAALLFMKSVARRLEG